MKVFKTSIYINSLKDLPKGCNVTKGLCHEIGSGLEVDPKSLAFYMLIKI